MNTPNLNTESQLTQQVITLFNQRDYVAAGQTAKLLTARYPRSLVGWKVLAGSLEQQGKHLEMIDPLKKAISLSPTEAVLHYNLGNVYRALDKGEDAVMSYRTAIQNAPEFAEAYCNLAIAIEDHEQEAAIGYYQKAAQIKPDYFEAHSNLAMALRRFGRVTESIDVFKKVILLRPQEAELYVELGLVYRDLGQHTLAIATLSQALQLKPNYALAHNALGTTFIAIDQFDLARINFQRAVEIEPEYAAAHHNLANVLRDYSQFDEAIACCQRAMEIVPEHFGAYGNLLFNVNYHPDLTSDQLYEYYREVEIKFGQALQSTWKPHQNDPSPDRKLRVGYVSPSLHFHSCRYFVEPLLAHHDKTKVEVYAYAQHQTMPDQYTERYKSYVDHWVPTKGMTHDALTERIRADQIDILVDLAGHTGYNRLEVFARKPAPVSVHWLDFGYTTGLKAIDYYLTDVPTIPVGDERFFSEEPWRLPTPAYAYRPPDGIGEVNELPALERGYITFGTLTRAVRLNHRVLKTWSAILRAIPDARLVINSGNFRDTGMCEKTAARFMEHGIERERLIIGCDTPPWDVLRGIDIGLDCFPHNSGTTLFETLYMGIPYVTLANRPSVGRLGTSILHGLGHPEWVADTEQDYIDKAVQLAQDTAYLSQLRKNLREKLKKSPLMDEIGFARAVEDAYRQMWRRWCATK